MPAAAYLVLTSLLTKLTQFAMLADLAICFPDSWLPKNMSYEQLGADRRPPNHMDLAPAEPRSRGLLWSEGVLTETYKHSSSVKKFIYSFKLELNQTTKISESSMKKK